MPVITITSDWNNNDYYLAAVKGQLLKLNEKFTITDINHNVKAFNLSQGAFIIRNSFEHFPENSIHLIYIDSEPDNDRKYMAVKAMGHYFIGTDNGIFNLILNENIAGKVELSSLEPDGSQSFPGLITFTEAAYRISKGEPFDSIGKVVNNYTERIPIRATIEENSISGSIIYIDSYGNAITNITKEIFSRAGNNNPFEIYVQSKHYTLTEINKTYNSVPGGDLLALFNSTGLLEIAINSGNASKLLNLNLNSNIRIEFLK
ncbi:MAG: SAM-dependent chlorinase/fluorinase [Bacteroidales bacterium]|nr:SAM-dependent chlorinase/fluorinase [Bacteroidales bacterium]